MEPHDKEIAGSGVQVVCLLALSDQGAPGFDAKNAAALAALGIPCFACTPDLFPDLMATALARRDLGAWAARHEVVAAKRRNDDAYSPGGRIGLRPAGVTPR